MVAFTSVLLGLVAAGASRAAPTAAAPAPVHERGPLDFTMGFDHPLSKRFGNFSNREIGPRSNTDYTQNYKTGGSVNFNPGTNQFTLNWNTQQDFVVGVGWKTGGHAYVN